MDVIPILDIWIVGETGIPYLHHSYSQKEITDDIFLGALLSALGNFIKKGLNDEIKSFQVKSKLYDLKYKIFKNFIIIILLNRNQYAESQSYPLLKQIGDAFHYYYDDYLSISSNLINDNIFKLFKPQLAIICDFFMAKNDKKAINKSIEQYWKNVKSKSLLAVTNEVN